MYYGFQIRSQSNILHHRKIHPKGYLYIQKELGVIDLWTEGKIVQEHLIPRAVSMTKIVLLYEKGQQDQLQY